MTEHMISRLGATRSPRRSQRERSESTRARLLDAAIGCLAEHGYAGATSAKVCERAGVTRGAQIHHFATQAALVEAAVERLADQAIAAFDAQMAARRGRDPLEAFLDGIWRTLDGPLFATSLELIVAARTDAALRRVLQPGLNRMQAMIAERVLAAAQAALPHDPAILETALEVSVRLVHGIGLDALLTVRQPRHEALWSAWTKHLHAIYNGALRQSVD